MADPLTALMYAVQVMKLLKSLTEKTVRERETSSSEVERRCNNEVQVGEKEEDSEEEEDGVYIIKEEEVPERIRMAVDEHKFGSTKSEFEESSASDSKGNDGAVQPPICSTNSIGSK